MEQEAYKFQGLIRSASDTPIVRYIPYFSYYEFSISNYFIAKTTFQKTEITPPPLPLLMQSILMPFVGELFLNHISCIPQNISVGIPVKSLYIGTITVWTTSIKTETIYNVSYSDAILYADIETPYTLKRRSYIHIPLYFVTLPESKTFKEYTITFETSLYKISITVRLEFNYKLAFRPLNGISEHLRWNTNIIETYTGEQRIALLDKPEISVEYKYIVDKELIAATFSETADNFFAVPIWHQAVKAEPIEAGAIEIKADTSSMDIKDLVVIYENDFINEALQIFSYDESTIQVVKNIEHSYTNPLVMPAGRGICDRMTTSQKYNRDLTTTTFRLQDKLSTKKNVLCFIYDDYYVFPFIGSLFFSELQNIIAPCIEVIDNTQTFGIKKIRDYIDKSRTVNVLLREDDINKFRSWLNLMQGRQKAFLLPGHGKDIVPIWGLSPDTSIPVESGFDSLTIQNILLHRRTFPIRTMLVTIYNYIFLNITSSTQDEDNIDTETITCEYVGQYPIEIEEVKIKDIIKWSILELVRHDTDEFVLEYSGDIMKSSYTVKEVKQ